MKLYLALILSIALFTATASKCGCDEFTRDVDCKDTNVADSCKWDDAGKSCSQKKCDSFTTETDCKSRIDNLGYDDDYYCYWTGKACKSFTKCSDRQYESAPTEKQCAGCKVSGNGCADPDKVACSSLDATKCAAVLTDYASTVVYDGDTCMVDGTSCVAITQSTACSSIKGDNVKNYCREVYKCAIVGTECKDRACSNFTVETDCVGGDKDNVCQWDGTACGQISRTADCSAAKKENPCRSIGCLWTNNACAAPSCATQNALACTDASYFFRDRTGKGYFCKKGTSGCVTSDGSDLTADNCLKQTGSWYRWTGSKCEACSDKSSNSYLAAGLFAVAMIGLL